MAHPRILVGIVLIGILSACSTTQKLANYFDHNKPDPIQKINLNPVRITPSRTDNARVAADRKMDILHMDLDVKFVWGLHQCIGTATILMKPYFYPTDTILLDAKSMVFDGIKINDKSGNEIQYLVDYNKKVLKLILERKLTQQDSIILTLKYTASPDDKEAGGSAAIRDDKGLYFINTNNKEPNKPIQIWTQGETESNSCWFPTIDKPNEKFTSTLTMHVNKNYTTLSNGELVSSIDEGNLRADKWVNKLPMSAYLIMMAIGDFTKTTDYLNGKEVSYYLEPAYESAARENFGCTPEMIDFYSNKLGVEYPWNKYAQVVVRDYVSGAMENTSATLHGESVQKNARELVDGNNEGIISHELFHQWFGDLVTCNSWSHLTLNEGFAAYGEQLWLEYKYGADASLQKSYTTMNRYVDYAKNQNDGPIVNFNFVDKEDMFNTLTYQKGSRVYHLLRSIIGDEAFFLGLKNYLTHYGYANAEMGDLQKEFETITGLDLRPFFDQWFYNGGHPVIDIRYDYNDSTKLLGVYIEQKQNADVGLFKFPLKFKVSQGNQIKYFTFNIEKRKEVFYVQKLIEADHSIPSVFVDPDATFLGEMIDNKSFINHIQTYNTASNYLEKVRPLKALSLVQTQADTIRYTMLSAMQDNNEDIRLKALQWLDWTKKDNFIRAKSLLQNIAKTDKFASVRAEALQVLGNAQDSSLITFFSDCLTDSSYTVVAKALQAIDRINNAEAIRICPTLEADARGKLFEAISSIYANSKDTSWFAFYRKNMMQVFNRKRAKLVEDYTALALGNNMDATLMGCTDLLKERASTDTYPYVRYMGMKCLYDIKERYAKVSKQTKDPSYKTHLSDQSEKINHDLQLIIQQENDKYVLDLLKTNGVTE